MTHFVNQKMNHFTKMIAAMIHKLLHYEYVFTYVTYVDRDATVNMPYNNNNNEYEYAVVNMPYNNNNNNNEYKMLNYFNKN